MPNIDHDFFEPWLEYQHPIVRQLAFALASPNILAHVPDALPLSHHFQLHESTFWSRQYQLYIPRLQQLDRNPHLLLDFLAALKSTRLGLRFEHLMWFWLQDHAFHHYQLLGHSIQKIDGARTLGELDFVVFNEQTRQVEHWEVALKYYLAEADFSLAHWYGLNRSDTLQRKLLHFTHRQFQFRDACGHHIEQRYAVLKGQLYLPLAPATQACLPTWVNSARRLGTWGHHIREDAAFYRLQRHEWICPDLHASSQANSWWTDGLYYHQQQHYMFRSPTLLRLTQANSRVKTND